MSRSINIEGIDLAAGSVVQLGDPDGRRIVTATVVRIARLGELPSGTTVIGPYNGELFTVERDGYWINLVQGPRDAVSGDPEELVPVIELHDQAHQQAA